MKKVRVTESQYKQLQLIKEQNEFTSRMKDKIADIGKNVDKEYRVLMYNTIAEIRDGDVDLGKMVDTLGVLGDKIHDANRRVFDYFERFTEETLHAQGLEEVRDSLDDSGRNVAKKIFKLDDMLNNLKPIAEDEELHEPFSNLTPTEIK